jgi:transposase
VPGQPALQGRVRAAQFYLLASARPDVDWSISPVGLSAGGYNNHVFWDAETWMYPALLAQHPAEASTVVDYRYRTQAGARRNARRTGYGGQRYAWESALTGDEVTPTWAETGRLEQHVTADVALAQWQFCEGEQGRCAKRRPRPGLTLGITGVLPSDRSVDQFPRTPPGAPSADGVTSEEPGLGPRRSTVRRLAVGALPANRRAGKDDMASLPGVVQQVTVGVDSHKDVHVAAAVDQVGRVLGTTWVPTTTQGSVQLLRWAMRLGQVQRFGIEGTGSFAAGLSRWLQQQGYQVVEVNRPNRQARRRRGKSDPVDAEAAARAALAGEATTTPKAANGTVEMLRVLRVARRSAIKARGQAANQLHSLLVTAPDPLRHQLRGLPLARLVQVAAAVRPGPLTDPLAATKFTLRELARRYQLLTTELDRLDAQLAALAAKAAPRLLTRRGVGAQVAGALLVVAGDNPGRLRSEAAFSMLCGSSPLPASSGKTVRHRLNRGGDRDANNALWTIAMTRLSCDERTQRYLARRTAEGKSKREIIRCLKRYIAREIYRDITAAVIS